MMIVDAIRSASTPHAVYFLVAAYIESLSHFERASGVPRDALALPIDGAADLENRLRSLNRHSQVPLEAIVPLSELTAVITCALERLSNVADAAAPGQLIPSARSDNRRSALSV